MVLLYYREQCCCFVILGDVIVDWNVIVFLGLCSMDDFVEGGFSLVDDILLEDYFYEDDCICIFDFIIDDYVRVIQFYYEGVVSRFVNFILEQFLWYMY